MLKDSTLATRGQVFYYNPLWSVFGKNKEPKGIQNNGSIEFKTRPYLVISTDKGNFSSTLCNLLPITTRSGINIPSQVKFTYDNRSQVILTEQPITANIKDLGEYLYTVSDEVMAQLRKGLYIQLDITPRTADVVLDNLAERLDNIVNRVLENSRKKVDTVSVEAVEELAIKLASGVEELLPKAEPVLEVKKPETDIKQVEHMSQIDKFNKKYGYTSAPKQPEKKPEQTVKKGGRKAAWDLETQKQFLVDVAQMTPEEVMNKYGLKDKKTVYSHKYLIKNRLEKMGETT